MRRNNRLFQQNRHKADIPAETVDVCFGIHSKYQTTTLNTISLSKMAYFCSHHYTPYSMEQGIVLAEQGIYWSEQGIYMRDQ